MCYGSMPTSFNAIILLIGMGIAFVVLVIVANVLEQIQMDPFERARISAVCFVVLIAATWFGIRKACRKYNKQALFVYDGGIHLNEDVSYVVNYGQWFEFCTGRRQVSLPWRVLKKFKATEKQRKGQPFVEASVRLPDGRTMTVSTVDGKQSAKAIETMLNHLAS